jgi:hypothetical protein
MAMIAFLRFADSKLYMASSDGPTKPKRPGKARSCLDFQTCRRVGRINSILKTLHLLVTMDLLCFADSDGSAAYSDGAVKPIGLALPLFQFENLQTLSGS